MASADYFQAVAVATLALHLGVGMQACELNQHCGQLRRGFETQYNSSTFQRQMGAVA